MIQGFMSGVWSTGFAAEQNIFYKNQVFIWNGNVNRQNEQAFQRKSQQKQT